MGVVFFEGNEALSFAHFSSTKLNSEVTPRHLNNRASFAVMALQILSGCPFDEVADGKEFDNELELLLTEIIRKKKGIFKKAAEAAGFSFLQKVTVAQAVDTKSLLRLSTSGFRRLRTIFSNMGLKIFPSEPKMRLYESSGLTHLQQADLAVDELLLESTGSSSTREIKTVHVLRARDLHSYICSVFAILNKRTTYFLEHPEREVNILIGGDKGGSYTKFHFEIVAPGIVSSAYNVHIFAMFEALDSRQNILKVLEPFEGQIKNMQHKDFVLPGGFKVKLFLNGDFKMLDLIMGHQTSATYPSIKDLVSSSHLKMHGGTPHTPENCKIKLREISDFMENFAANVVDDRVGTVNTKGKHHFSIVGTPLIPITSLSNVVPPVLHITLGIVLKLFEMILSEVRKLDCNHITEVRKKKEKEWEDDSNALKVKKNDMHKLCDKLLDLMNFKERFMAKLNNNVSELDQIAQICSGRVKKQKKMEPCSSFSCLASQFDDKLEWVQCDQCEDCFHMMCEGIPGCEYPQVELMAHYICSKCRELDEYSISDDIACKIESLHDEVKSLEIAVNELTVKCEKVRQESGNSMGDFERHLLSILDDIGVKRQAYHGNVFVGNHCKVILAKDRDGVFNFSKLCSVLPDESLKKKFFDLFELYSVARNLMARKGYLNSEEIDTLVFSCHGFGAKFPVYFPDVPLTRKIHELAFDVPRFVKEHKTVGLFSEEEGESIHHAINLESAQLVGVRQKDLQLRLLIERHETRAQADQSLLATRPRKCRECVGQERPFLKNNTCPIHGPQF